MSILRFRLPAMLTPKDGFAWHDDDQGLLYLWLIPDGQTWMQAAAAWHIAYGTLQIYPLGVDAPTNDDDPGIHIESAEAARAWYDAHPEILCPFRWTP